MRKLLLFATATMLIAVHMSAQNDNQDEKYRRSSLSMILIESDAFPNKESVIKSWNNYPFPDKYDKHDITTKSVNLKSIELTQQDILDAGYYKDTLKTFIQILGALKNIENQLVYLNPEQTIAVEVPGEMKITQLKINKILKDNEIAKQMVSTWFNRSSDGTQDDFDVIAKRGKYNASDLDADMLKGVYSPQMGDIGAELIKNSFTTFTAFEFIENEPVARLLLEAAKAGVAEGLKGKPQILIDQANKAAQAIYEKTKEGYSLWSKSWLYQLNWNDTIMADFYMNLWNDKKAFDASNLFQMNFVGVQYNMSLVTFKLGETRTQDQLIDLALVRNLDNAFAKLQKKNDVFKPLIRIATSTPITAQIGMKEGLEGGETFEVLQMGEKDGRTVYTKIGTLKADKKVVWDNRYNGGEPPTPQIGKDGNPISATTFKGGKVQVGFLIKLVK